MSQSDGIKRNDVKQKHNEIVSVVSEKYIEFQRINQKQFQQ